MIKNLGVLGQHFVGVVIISWILGPPILSFKAELLQPE